jgi:hypothetical protein
MAELIGVDLRTIGESRGKAREPRRDHTGQGDGHEHGVPTRGEWVDWRTPPAAGSPDAINRP